MVNNTPSLNILLLCENENAANLEKRTLREAGFNHVQVMTSAVEAAHKLSGQDSLSQGLKTDVVICQHRLADMEGEQLCAILRLHPVLKDLPILLILPNENMAEHLKASGCAANAFVCRPYSMDSLKKAIYSIWDGADVYRNLRTANSGLDISAFEEALANNGVLLKQDRSPEDYFKMGMGCLADGRWSIAVSAFEKAMRDTRIRAEAQLGLAAAHKGKGNMAAFKECLANSAETFISTKRWGRARTAYARLLQYDPGAKNPFIVEVNQLVREENYAEAARVLVEGISLMPKQKIGEKLARICLSAPEPQKMQEAMKGEMESAQVPLHDSLIERTQASLDELLRQREERKRQKALERQWILSQQLKQAEKESKALQDKGTKKISDPIRPGQVAKIELLGKPDTPELYNKTDYPGETTFLQPLGEQDATSELFAKKPRLNELLSVVKFTWNLSRRTKKKD